MPQLTIQGHGTVEAADGERLVLAIARAGVQIGHRCGGKAKCTTCRVAFTDGEPGTMTRPEYEKLEDRDLLGEVRLACQIVCDHDMSVDALMTVSEMGWDDPGPAPAPEVEPEAEWHPKAELEG